MHQHGTLASRKIGRCDCKPCRDAGNRYNARRDYLVATGRWQPYTDAEPVRRHVNQLRDAGLGWQRIAELAGISTPAVQRLLYGYPSGGKQPTRRVRLATAAALLAVHADLDTLAGGAQIDATGTRRRSQALAMLGWSQGWQARHLGMGSGNYSRTNTSALVTVARARAVRALYDEFSMRIPAYSPAVARTRTYATRRGWAPPLAWDDDTIDDPAAKPDIGEAGPRQVAIVEDYDELIGQGYTPLHATERLGVTRGYVDKARIRTRPKEVAA